MTANAIPRPEYPRPQFRRERWLNLNGPWSFADDPQDAGESLAWHSPGHLLPDTIVVPFCREAPLSGLGRADHVAAVWYAREVTIPAGWVGQRILLHFGAADYETSVWLDGHAAGPAHRGGHTSFTLDLTDLVRPGQTHRLTIRCRDDHRQSKPCGKQRSHPENSGCHYTHTTGIWQTVWLEPVPPIYLERPRITPSLDAGGFLIEPRIAHPPDGPLRLRARLHHDGETFSEASVPVASDFTPALWLPIPEIHRRPWCPADPFLYDIEIQLETAGGMPLDQLDCYAGLRSIAIRGHRVFLNGQAIFQRLILDQGYYPDGLLTAPDDQSLIDDIRLGLDHGFNGARLHQKIFEERFLHHADRLGYLVWGELPDWSYEFQKHEPKSINAHWIEEWLDAVARDYSHPALIVWCPLNEQEGQEPAHLAEIEVVQRSLVLATRLADRSRPVIDSSGWIHHCAESDLYDDHNYEQDPAVFGAKYHDLGPSFQTWRGAAGNLPVAGRPFLVGEFGGAVWLPAREAAAGGDAAWGYGSAPRSAQELVERFSALAATLLDNPRCAGYCYTQLTDVFQECNGLATFDRVRKFDPAAFRAAQTRPAAIESMNV